MMKRVFVVLCNVVWVVTGGWLTCLALCLFGVGFCITWIGRDLGIDCLRAAPRSLWPFSTAFARVWSRGVPDFHVEMDGSVREERHHPALDPRG